MMGTNQPLTRPVCVQCGLVMLCEKNEHGVEFYSDYGSRLGRRFYSGDRYGCKRCGLSVVVGFGKAMSSDEDGYEAHVNHVSNSEAFTLIDESGD